jgi:hypothetical protein
MLLHQNQGDPASPLIGNSGNIQDALAAGANVVTSGSMAVAATQTPALLVSVSMNTSGGSSDTGGSDFGGPAAGTGFTQVTQMWNWGVNLGTFELAAVPSAGNVAALFNAPDTDSFVTVAAVFVPTVPGFPPVVTLAATPASIVIGQSSTLTWSVSNAAPVQPQDCVHAVALVLDQVNVELAPDVMVVGAAVNVTVGPGGAGGGAVEGRKTAATVT